MTCTLLTVCLHPSHDLQTLLTMLVSNNLMTCRHFWQWVHPFHDLQTHLTVFVFIHLMTCRHFWLCSSRDLKTVFVFIRLMTCRHIWQSHQSHDLQTLLTVFLHLLTSRHFLRWALLSLDNTTFSFSTFYKLFPGYNLILMPLFCISGTMRKTRSPCVVPKFAREQQSARGRQRVQDSCRPKRKK